MELVYLLSGGAPIVKRFLASAAIDNAGIVLEADDAAAGSGVGGVSLPAASAVGGPSVGDQHHLAACLTILHHFRTKMTVRTTNRNLQT